MPTLKQLKYLDALARERNYARAAASCHISQPALSMQIKELEAELGLVLVERGRGTFAMTEAGEEIVRRARSILRATDDLVDYARHADQPLSGTLRFGVIPTIAPYLLPRALPLIRARFPDIALELREAQTADVVDDLSRGVLDLVLLSPPIDAPDIETFHMFDDRFLLVTQADEALDERKRIDISSISGRRLLLLSEGHCLREQALSVCRTADRDTLGELGATSLTTIVQMVANGFGATLLPEMAIDAEIRDDRTALLRFRAPEPSRQIGLAWRRTSARKQDFIAIGEALSELAPAA
ncbi:hydrogen peroxide-inducible genes activator [Microbaculum marinisediminis]|uniref:LysR substrate-binding domain-containing protein n=1 Tax=Microbaculum marinisediminis TaxID=2931392 RepID=A0AAW5R0W6_9HYPH|nr:hydrogen peroxide-inducible genes activator [Microbaculum sp. A6E488]MCT8972503.1 LysR substrate-binding domain-containing protein [Microbaculum sp. A6E488]